MGVEAGGAALIEHPRHARRVTAIFVYGTLRHPPVIDRLLGRVPTSRPARLAGWRAAPLAGRVFPGLVRDPEAATDGEVVEVSPDELAVLDRFEGPLYDRIDVTTDVGDAQVWVLREASGEVVMPGVWDLGRFVSDDAERFLGR